jgi:hypothetical protein
VAIEKQGDASLTVAASPDGGTQVDVRAPKANGRKTMRNIEITIAARARIGDPGAPGASSEPEAATSAPQ